MSAPDADWDAHEAVSLTKNQCPYTGLGGPECKASVCECYEYECLWGERQDADQG